MMMMEKTQSWSKQNQIQREESIQIQQVERQHQLKDSNKKNLIEQPLPSQKFAQEIQDDLTTLRNKQNKSPLVFYGPVGTSFIFSFNKQQQTSFMIRFLIMAGFMCAVQVFVQIMANIKQQIKHMLIVCTVLQVLCLLLLFYLDPGTLFEDQPQKANQQRLYCQSCRFYRNHKTQHCKYCLKCVKNYDHHCGFFGKCIGQRNFPLYCLFILLSGLCGMGNMGSLLFTVMKSVTSQIK